jgi:hypothetical protein
LFNKGPKQIGVASLLAHPGLRLFFVFCGLFTGTVATHTTLLRLPYYWDEAGYYIPAAYDFFRTGTLIPFSTLTNAHPPLLSIYLALLWKLFGFAPGVTRIGMAAASACALTAVFAITRRALHSVAAAWTIVLVTAAYPVWFAQATLAQADGLAAAATLWGLYFVLPLHRYQLGQRHDLDPNPDHGPGLDHGLDHGPGLNRLDAGEQRSVHANLWAASVCFTLAALTKEIAIGTPLALACWELAVSIRAHRAGLGAAMRRAATRRATLWRAAALASPVVPLAAWFAYHHWRTGFTFGNPQYLRYNATSTLNATRFLLALAHRVLHLTVHLNLFVPVFVALGSLLLPVVHRRFALARQLRAEVWVVLVANALLFSLLGGALLTRYLLPVYPFVILLTLSAILARFTRWVWFPALSIAAFVAALLLPSPYQVAPEDTLAYRNAVLLEQAAIDEVVQRYPQSSVLSAWPVTDGLRKPELGYIKQPLSVVAIDNFSLGALQQLVSTPADYTTAIIFSTKDEPPSSWRLPFAQWNQRQDTRYFAFHQDLRPGTVAALLHGTIVWQAHRGAQWAAVLRFAHPQLAAAALPAQTSAPASYNQP